MGMYDLVLPEANLVIGKCPYCKKKFNIDQEWQTKSYKSLLFNVSLRTLRYFTEEHFEIHTICDNCGIYLKVHFNKENPRIEFYDAHSTRDITRSLSKSQLQIYDYVSIDKESLVNYERTD